MVIFAWWEVASVVHNDPINPRKWISKVDTGEVISNMFEDALRGKFGGIKETSREKC